MKVTQTGRFYSALKKVKKGSVIMRHEGARKAYVRGDYVRGKDYRGWTINKYSCTDIEDINREVFIKGDTEVYVLVGPHRNIIDTPNFYSY